MTHDGKDGEGVSNFRKLGDSLIDFDRVRIVVASPNDMDGPGLWVQYTDGASSDFVHDPSPIQTLDEFYEREFPRGLRTSQENPNE